MIHDFVFIDMLNIVRKILICIHFDDDYASNFATNIFIIIINQGDTWKTCYK